VVRILAATKPKTKLQQYLIVESLLNRINPSSATTRIKILMGISYLII